MLFFGGVSDLSFCYRDLSAWWENRTDQPGTQYYFVITGRLFLWCNAPVSLSFCSYWCKYRKPPAVISPEAFYIEAMLRLSLFHPAFPESPTCGGRVSDLCASCR